MRYLHFKRINFISIKRKILLPFLLCFTFEFVNAQVISYLIPDIGTPGMNTYMEIIGPNDQTNNFGVSGTYLNNPGDAVRVECVNVADTNKIKIGPLLVSWDGKMISTQVFVMPGVQPNSDDWQNLASSFRIPLHVKVSGSISNVDTFYIVKPQPAITAAAAGVIGSGGTMGIRSRRGAMILESLSLSGNAVYTISTLDCDPVTPGEQGYLPAVILSKGPVTISAGTTLSMNATDNDAGAGGGGGGNGLQCGTRGGNGFTGGGGNDDWGSGCGLRPSGHGSGPGTSALNGTMGGDSSQSNEGGGGGTGLPFGLSGDDGTPFGSSVGAYGGGSGGTQPNFEIEEEGGGGGGGYASPGNDGALQTGGKISGNPQCVPLAGGSGGGGGNVNVTDSAKAGNGGGGGGVCHLYSVVSTVIDGSLSSIGGKGRDGINIGAGGGGGSGGAFVAGSKLNTKVATVDLSGGTGGTTQSTLGGQAGGKGGAGVFRYEGPITGAVPSVTPLEATKYVGLSSDTSMTVKAITTLTGTGNGQPIKIYLKPETGSWKLYTTVTGYANNKWTADLVLTCPDTLFLVAVAMQVANSGGTQYAKIPDFVFSQAAANILLTDASSISADAGPDATILLGSSTALHATGGTNYSWYPGTGLSDSTIASPNASPDSTTTYYVDVTDSSGCHAIDSVTVFVNEEEPCDEFFVPNSFSPNGDGENEVFYVRGSCFKSFELHIYNRWGQKLFETIEPTDGWNGMLKNNPMPVGVYTYYVHAIFNNNNEVSQRGNINLVW